MREIKHSRIDGIPEVLFSGHARSTGFHNKKLSDIKKTYKERCIEGLKEKTQGPRRIKGDCPTRKMLTASNSDIRIQP